MATNESSSKNVATNFDIKKMKKNAGMKSFAEYQKEVGNYVAVSDDTLKATLKAGGSTVISDGFVSTLLQDIAEEVWGLIEDNLAQFAEDNLSEAEVFNTFGLSGYKDFCDQIKAKISDIENNAANVAEAAKEFKSALKEMKDAIEHIGVNIKSSVEGASARYTRTFNNESIGDMLRAGPSLRSNMFDIGVVYYDITHSGTAHGHFTETKSTKLSGLSGFVNSEIGGDGSSDAGSDARKDFFANSSMMLALRSSSVDLPMPKRETIEIGFLNTSFSVPGSSVRMDNTATLNVDLDLNTYMLEAFSSISGLKRHGTFDGEDNEYYIQSPNVSFLQQHRIDLVVKIHVLGNYYEPYFSGQKQSAESPIMYAIFQDVRFLGTSSQLQFNRDEATGRKKLAIPFIFRDVQYVHKADYVIGLTESSKLSYTADDEHNPNSYNTMTSGESKVIVTNPAHGLAKSNSVYGMSLSEQTYEVVKNYEMKLSF